MGWSSLVHKSWEITLSLTVKVSHNKVSLESRPYLTSGPVWLNWTQIYCSPGPILFSLGQTNTDIRKTLYLDTGRRVMNGLCFWSAADCHWSLSRCHQVLICLTILANMRGPSFVTPCVCPVSTVGCQCLCQMIQDINICAAIRNQNWPGCINDN